MPHYANGYLTTLSGSLTNVATTCTVASVTGAPALPFKAIIAAEGANTSECVLVTGIASLTLTIVRAVEPVLGVAGASAHASGAPLGAAVTAADLHAVSAGGLLYAYQNFR